MFAGVGTFEVAQNAAATGRTGLCAAMLGCAAFLAGAYLALLNARSAKYVVGGFLQLFARYEFIFAIVSRAGDAKAQAVAAVGEGPIASDLTREMLARMALSFLISCILSWALAIQ